MIKLVVGLGNPGKEYERTRHNVGWMVIDRVKEKVRAEDYERRFKGFLTYVPNSQVILLKPATFMNNSGESVKEVASHYKIRPEEILLIYDDLDLPVGKLRLRLRGSSGGHKGVLSVEKSLGSNNFPRLRIGIGRPKRKEEVVDYVLSPFGEDEAEVIETAISKAVDCVVEIIKRQNITQDIMSRYNQ
jgi:PTH1 family peptidyl-tRNA hydrolase